MSMESISIESLDDTRSPEFIADRRRVSQSTNRLCNSSPTSDSNSADKIQALIKSPVFLHAVSHR